MSIAVLRQPVAAAERPALDLTACGAAGILLDQLRCRGGVSLRSGDIGGSVWLDGCEISAVGPDPVALNLEAVSVGRSVLARTARIRGGARLYRAGIGANLELDGSWFEDRRRTGMALDGQGMTVGGTVSLATRVTPARFEGRLNLVASRIGQIRDDEASWPGPGDLDLEGCDYGYLDGPVGAGLRLRWLARQQGPGSIDMRPQPYGQLATVLAKMGHEDAARTVLVAREAARRTAEMRRAAAWRKPGLWMWNQLLRMVGYGYRPARAVLPSLLFVALGWALIDRAAPGAFAATKAAESGMPATKLVPLAYSFEAFVPLVKLGQIEAIKPDMATPCGYWLQVYLWIHGFAGWLIGGIAAAGVLGLFRRD